MLEQIKDFNFWFDVNKSLQFLNPKIILYLGLGLIFLSLLLLTFAYVLFKNSKAWAILRENVFYFLFISGLLILLFWFFNFQQIVYLGANIVLVVIALAVLIWIVYIAIIFKKTFLPHLSEERDWQRKAKYLPHNKSNNKKKKKWQQKLKLKKKK